MSNANPFKLRASVQQFGGKKNVPSFQPLKHKLRRVWSTAVCQKAVLPSEFSKVLIAPSPKKLSFFSSAAVCPFSNSTFSVQLCTSCSVRRRAPSSRFRWEREKRRRLCLFVCLCSGNAHTYEKPSFYRRALPPQA